MKILSFSLFVMFNFLFIISLQTGLTAVLQPSKIVTFQGFLTDSNGESITDSTYDLTFSIWDGSDSSNDNKLWEETHTAVSTERGIFSVFLGEVTSFPYTMTFSDPYFIGVKVEDKDIMEPLLPLTSTWTSFRSLTSAGKNIRSTNQNYSLSDIDDILFVDGAITLTLPSAASVQTGRIFSIYKTDSGTTTQIITSGTETINGINRGSGGSALTFDNQYEHFTFISNGQNWISPVYLFGELDLADTTLVSLATSSKRITFPDASGIVVLQSEAGDVLIDNALYVSGPMTVNGDSISLSPTIFLTAASSSNTITFPDASGTVALLSGNSMFITQLNVTGSLTVPNGTIISDALNVTSLSINESISATEVSILSNSPSITVTNGNASFSGLSISTSNIGIVANDSAITATNGNAFFSGLSISTSNIGIVANDSAITATNSNASFSGLTISTSNIGIVANNSAITATNGSISVDGMAVNGNILTDGLSVSGPISMSEFTANSASITHLVITGDNSLIVNSRIEVTGEGVFNTIEANSIKSTTLSITGTNSIMTCGAPMTVYGLATFNTIVANNSITALSITVGSISKQAGSFKIDHPLDPENKYLFHSFVESPDMMNIYNGIIATDDNGFAIVQLPDYFEALNKDFRYQLTCIGSFAKAIILKKINNNQFTIQTDHPDIEVSWQVTGIRKDPYAEDHRIQVEVEKPDDQKGTYIYH
ncbi:hypothetical protein MHK_003775 [Candidatus Magnetomorum sp. HK-1]|nr:hypothetical protein MHK_003775 [Candidatus Magnetomorum sp. HK-1]